MRHPIRAMLALSLLAALAACSKPDSGSATAEATAAADAAIAAAPAGDAEAAPVAPSEADFELTMDKVDDYLAGVRELAALVEADPEMEDATTMNVSREDGARFAARLESNPQVVAALTKAGTNARDYALTGELLIAAMMAQGALESGALKEIPEGMDPDAVEFVKQNKTELEAKFKALQAGS